ncbi:MAG TPA: flippase [Chitinophagaceae bacterium]|nr:flippase [Chitinophagaceae bacterium]
MASIRKNLAFNFLLSASQLLLPLISIPYVSHVLDPEGIGNVSFIDSLTYYFISISEFGIVVYGMREVARLRTDREALTKLVSELLTLHLISTIISIFLYGITIFFLWSRIPDFRLILFSLSFLMVNAFACEWYYYGTEQFRYISLRSILTRLCGLAGIFILVHNPPDYYLYYAIIAGTGIVNILWNVFELRSRLRIRLFISGWKKHISKTWVTYLISLSYSISLMLDSVLLGLVSAAAFVGFYAFAVKLVRLSAMALTDTLLVYFPHVVALLHNQEKEKFQQAILRNVQLLNLFSIPIGVGLFFLSNEITSVVFGPAFSPVALDLRILSIVPFLKCYNLFLSKQVLIAYDNEKLYLRSLFASGIIFVLATVLLSYFLKDVGASIAMVIYETCLLFFNYYFVKKTDSTLKVFDWKSVLHALAGAAIFIPLIIFSQRWMEADWLWLTLVIGVSAFAYILFQVFVLKNELMIGLRRWGLKYVSNSFQKNDQT